MHQKSFSEFWSHAGGGVFQSGKVLDAALSGRTSADTLHPLFGVGGD